MPEWYTLLFVMPGLQSSVERSVQMVWSLAAEVVVK